MANRVAFIGLNWWGLGPADMATSLSHVGYESDSLGLWNIGSRSDRLLMESAVSPAVAMWRLKRFLRASGSAALDAIFVMSPHRFGPQMLSYLRGRCTYLVALLGDDPVGARAVSSECWNHFDLVVAADEVWLERLRGFEGRRKLMYWGSTLLDSELISPGVYKPDALVIVGAPYPERIEVAQTLATQNPLTLQGAGWPAMMGVRTRSSRTRAETLHLIRENRELVVNVHHAQFKKGLNPQFFDYAAAGIPQIVIYAHDLERFTIGVDRDMEAQILDGDLLQDEHMLEQNRKTTRIVREQYMFHSCIERVLDVV